MTRESIINDMKIAFELDRSRYFAVADTLQYQPKYADVLEDLEALNQEWRDIPDLINYPEMPHPIALPEWFPSSSVKFVSNWGEGYVDQMMAGINDEENEEGPPPPLTELETLTSDNEE